MELKFRKKSINKNTISRVRSARSKSGLVRSLLSENIAYVDLDFWKDEIEGTLILMLDEFSEKFWIGKLIVFPGNS